MSLIVAIKAEDRIYVGCDSQVTTGDRKDFLTNSTWSKVWSVKGLALMGGVGYARDSQIVMTNDVFSELSLLKGEIDFKYLVNEGFEALYNLLVDKRCVDIEDGVYSPCLKSSFLFAQDDRAYAIYGSGYIEEIDDFLLLGSGSDVAEGILLSNKDKHPAKRIEEAIQAATNKTCSVGGDIILFSTVNDEEDAEQLNHKKIRPIL